MKDQLLALFLVTALLTSLVAASQADVYRVFEDIVLSRGYAVEEHQVLTEDGFILSMQRIPGKYKDYKKKPGPPVLLMHGLIDSSDGWVSNDNNSPAFILAREGYDVWLSNSRGNKKSKRHIKYTTSEAKFWDFSWEENGQYDDPAYTEYITSMTGYQKLAYIGHSMGTTQAFYAMTLRPEYYKKKWSIMIALAPPLTLEDINSPIEDIMSKGSNAQIYESTMKYLNQYETFPSNWINTAIMQTVCLAVPDICKLGDYLLADEDPNLNDEISTAIYFSHYPSGGSMKTFMHFNQCAISKKYQKYDYGKEENLKKYGSETPPEIDLNLIQNMPIAIFAGTMDNLAALTNSRKAKAMLDHTLIHYGEYDLGHLSFLVAKNMTYFSNDVVNLLKQYHPINQQKIQ